MSKIISSILILILMIFIQACGQKNQSPEPVQNFYTPLSKINSDIPQQDPLPQKTNRVSFTLPQLDLGQSPTIHLQNIHVVVTPNNLSMKAEGLGTLFQSTDNTIDISIDSITIDEVIQKDFNGVVVNLVTQAQCRTVKANIHDSKSMLSGLLLKDTGDWRIENPIVQIEAPEFQMTMEKCIGAQGFDQLIESTIRKDLQDHQLMSQLISEYLIPRMTNWGNSEKTN